MSIRDTIDKENESAHEYLTGGLTQETRTNNLLYLIYKRLGDIEEILWNQE